MLHLNLMKTGDAEVVYEAPDQDSSEFRRYLIAAPDWTEVKVEPTSRLDFFIADDRLRCLVGGCPDKQGFGSFQGLKKHFEQVISYKQ